MRENQDEDGDGMNDKDDELFECFIKEPRFGGGNLNGLTLL